MIKLHQLTTRIRLAETLLLAFIVLLISFEPLYSGNKNNNKSHSHQTSALYPDEYSELDDKPIERALTDQIIVRTLENARQQYLQALVRIDRKDTLRAAKHFEKAIDILNSLVSYPGIEQNEEFTDLAQSIIDDYETFIDSIENLDENTSLFIIRDKLYQEIDKYATSVSPEIQSIVIPIDTLPGTSILPYNYQPIIPLDDNDYVQKNISFLTTLKLGKKFVMDCLERKSRWFPLFMRVAKEEDVPLEIAFLSMIESRLDPNAVSKAKAVGLWQFIRSTGEHYGLNKNSSIWLDERRDPEKATRAAIKHLKDLYIELGHWHLAFAAYNCGLGCVRRTIQRSKKENPNFWDIADKLPRETRNYVPQYIATAKIMLNPEAYGFNLDDITPHEEYKYETVTLNEPVNISALAKCAQTNEETIKFLNPELIRSITPPDRNEYTLKIPVGTSAYFMNNYALLTSEEKMPLVNHQVQKGETITSIAQLYSVSPREVASFNGITNVKAKLNRGSALRIPIENNDVKAETIAKGDAPNENASETQNVSEARKLTHTVVAGDNLYQISQRYGVRISDLRNWNNLPYDSDNISVGTELVIAMNEALSANSPEPVITKIEQPRIIKHKVKAGETLTQIAQEYGVTAESIAELNKIKKNRINSGQYLKINTVYSDGGRSYTSDNVALKNHSVKRGENLGNIAARYGVTEEDIRTWNPDLIDGSTIYAGTKLKIYTSQSTKGASQPRAKSVNKAPKHYTIKSGDTLSEIARKFGVSVASLKKKNKKINENRLMVGQRIRIQ